MNIVRVVVGVGGEGENCKIKIIAKISWIIWICIRYINQAMIK